MKKQYIQCPFCGQTLNIEVSGDGSVRVVSFDMHEPEVSVAEMAEHGYFFGTREEVKKN